MANEEKQLTYEAPAILAEFDLIVSGGSTPIGQSEPDSIRDLLENPLLFGDSF